MPADTPTVRTHNVREVGVRVDAPDWSAVPYWRALRTTVLACRGCGQTWPAGTVTAAQAERLPCGTRSDR